MRYKGWYKKAVWHVFWKRFFETLQNFNNTIKQAKRDYFKKKRYAAKKDPKQCSKLINELSSHRTSNMDTVKEFKFHDRVVTNASAVANSGRDSIIE